MSAVPFPSSANAPQGIADQYEAASGNAEWLRISAGVTLLGGALLLLSGNRRAGLLATAAGTALTMLDQKETVKACWDALPGYLDKTQRMLDEAQRTVDDIAAKRERLREMIGR